MFLIKLAKMHTPAAFPADEAVHNHKTTNAGYILPIVIMLACVSLLLRVGSNNVHRSLLRDLHQRHRDVSTRDLGEDTGVHNTEPAGAADLELAVEHSLGIAIGTNRAGARGVVAPSLVLEVSLDIGIAGGVGLGGPGLLEAAIERDQLLKHLARQVDTLTQSLEVLGGTNGVGKVVEVDEGGVAGVGRLELDGAGGVASVHLEDDPSPVPRVEEGILRVAGEVSAEVGWGAGDDEIRVATLGDGGLLDDGDRDTVGGVHALGRRSSTLLPLGEARVIGCAGKGATLDEVKVRGGLADDGVFVTVLHVGADTGQVDDNGDLEGLELGARANTAELEELGGVVGASRDDDLAGGGDAAVAGRDGVAGTRVSAVKRLALHKLDSSRTGDAAALVEDDLSGLGREGQQA